MRSNWLVPEGWPGIKYTLAATIANDQDGFYFLEKDGQKIASISVVTYPEINFAYIGFYLVKKPFRGKGFGKLLITRALEYTAIKRGITSFGLNCIESAAPMYQKYGFKIHTTDEFYKYTATSESINNLSSYKLTTEVIKVSSINDTMFFDLINYDASILGAHRNYFLHNFLTKPNTVTVIAQDDGKVSGYGVISERDPATIEPNKSYKLRPLYADNSAISYRLLQQLIKTAKPGENIYLEVPGNNPAGSSLVRQFGFEYIGEQRKMFKGIAPSLFRIINM